RRFSKFGMSSTPIVDRTCFMRAQLSGQAWSPSSSTGRIAPDWRQIRRFQPLKRALPDRAEREDVSRTAQPAKRNGRRTGGGLGGCRAPGLLGLRGFLHLVEFSLDILGEGVHTHFFNVSSVAQSRMAQTFQGWSGILLSGRDTGAR